MAKLKIYHFHNGTGGGVFSVIKNLLRFSGNSYIESHIIYGINKEILPHYNIEPLEGASSQQVYYYTAANNFFYTCRQLAKLIPDDKAIIVAHDWLELGMMSNLGLQNPVVHFLHGDYDYYYQLAKKNEPAINAFICIAENIAENLKKKIPHRKNDIFYQRFPVASVSPIDFDKKAGNNIIFIGRLTDSKGFNLLSAIARELNAENNHLIWHIAGDDAAIPTSDKNWGDGISVTFHGNISNQCVMDLLKEMKFLILPSLAEGMPVTIVEAMKAGVIPLVNNIAGGIQELVTDGETGFKIENNSREGYVNKIKALLSDTSTTASMQQNCISLANQMFDPVQNTKIIEETLLAVSIASREKKHPAKIYGSRLDENWIPNFITKTIRHW